MTEAGHQCRVTALVGRLTPCRSGGEIYNAYLFRAAEAEGIVLTYAVLIEAPLESRLAGRFVWRFRALPRSLYICWRAWRSQAPLLIDVWLAPYLWPWALLSGRRCLLMVHHLRAHLEASPLRRGWLGWCERLLVNRAEQILTVSRSSRKQIETLLRSPVPIGIVHPGFTRPRVETVKSKSGDGGVHLLYAGAVTRAKGVLDLLNALRRIPGEPPWVMHIVGNTEAEPETTRMLRQGIIALPEPERVHVYGHVDDERLEALYAMADLFVLPSRWEGYGIVFLEAMARGLPVVATTAGAIPEVVEHMRTGLLVAPGDAKGLAEALETTIADTPLRLRLGQAAHDAALGHADWGQMKQRCREWWQGVRSRDGLVESA